MLSYPISGTKAVLMARQRTSERVKLFILSEKQSKYTFPFYFLTVSSFPFTLY